MKKANQRRYLLQAYYQPREGMPHEKVSIFELRERVGVGLADRAILDADDAMREKSLPQVKAFMERGGIQVIAVSLTNRGNIYIEAQEL